LTRCVCSKDCSKRPLPLPESPPEFETLRQLEQLAAAQPDVELRDLLAKRRPGKRRVKAHDIALGPVGNPAEDVPSRSIGQRKAHKGAASVVSPSGPEPERPKVLMETHEDLWIEKMFALGGGDEQVIRRRL